MKQYFLYDGRYRYNEDRACLYEVCDTLKEAKKSAKDYGDDTVIVEYEITNNVATAKKVIN